MADKVGSIEYDARINTAQFKADAASLHSSAVAAGQGISSGLSKSLDSIGRMTASVGSSIRSFGSGISEAGQAASAAASTIGGPLFKVTAVAGGGLALLAKGAFDSARQIENARLNLTSFTGSAEKADAVTRDLIRFATSDRGVLLMRTDLLNAAQSLAVFGVEADKISKSVQIMSKVITIGRVGWDDLNNVIGRVIATGRLSGIEFDELRKAGIKLDPALRNTAISADKLFEAIDKGVPESVLEGKVNTIEGAMVRLKSAFLIAGSAMLGLDRETGKFIEGGAGDQFMDFIVNLTAAIKSPEVITGLQNIGKAISDFAVKAAPLILGLVKFIGENIDVILKLWAGWVLLWGGLKVIGPVLSTTGALMQGFGVAIEGVGKAIQFVALAFKVGLSGAIAQTIPLLANPVFWVIAGVLAAIAAAVYLVWKNWDTLKPILESIVGVIKSVGDGFKSVWDTLQPLALGLFLLFKKVWDMLKPLRDWIGDQFIQVWNSLKASFDSVRQSLEPILPVLKTIAMVFGILIIATIAAVVIVIGGLVAAIALIAVGIAKVIGWFVQFNAWLINMQTKTEETSRAVWNSIVNVWNSIFAFFSNIFGMIWDLTVHSWNSIYGFLSGIVSTIWNRITSAFQNIYNGVVNILGSLFNFVSSIPGRVLSAIGNVGSLLYNVGRDIIQGLINGIRDMIGHVKNVAGDVAGAAKDKLKGILGIRSPSTVFAGYGKDIVRGLVGGINASSGMVDSAMSQLGLAINPPTLAGDVGVGGGMPTGGNTYNIKVDVSGIAARSRQDLREIGKDIVESVNEELRAKGVTEIPTP